MKKVSIGVIVCVLSLFVVTAAFASLAQFAGEWENVNPNTRGVTALKITVSGTNVKVHAWGQCTPTDCDWGDMQAYAYAPNVSSNLAASAVAVSVVHKESFAERLMILRSSGTQLQAATYTRFTDTSGRTAYADVEMFKRKAPCTAPKQLAPPNGSTFNKFPRTTTLKWQAVSCAKSYTVEIDCFMCCEANKWCTDVGKEYKLVPNVNATQYTFDFVGAQPGRWRVWAVDASGKPGPKSTWWGFKYTK